jgi:acyl carrier protein
METSEILKEVNSIFTYVLDNDKINLTRESSSENVEEWDSLTHIQLIVAIEKHFKIQLISSEIRNWKNVGELCDAIARRKSAQ